MFGVLIWLMPSAVDAVNVRSRVNHVFSWTGPLDKGGFHAKRQHVYPQGLRVTFAKAFAVSLSALRAPALRPVLSPPPPLLTQAGFGGLPRISFVEEFAVPALIAGGL